MKFELVEKHATKEVENYVVMTADLKKVLTWRTSRYGNTLTLSGCLETGVPNNNALRFPDVKSAVGVSKQYIHGKKKITLDDLIIIKIKEVIMTETCKVGKVAEYETY